uniref:Uncharacterized protein n=1 Tax=Anguilla anguilla TaxID=7936 RepID=A0A0E9WIV7_ANGAN
MLRCLEGGSITKVFFWLTLQERYINADRPTSCTRTLCPHPPSNIYFCLMFLLLPSANNVGN